MKKNYEELELKVIRFASEDVITASGEECTKVLCVDMVCKDKICLDMVCKDKICVDMIEPCMEKCVM